MFFLRLNYFVAEHVVTVLFHVENIPENRKEILIKGSENILFKNKLITLTFFFASFPSFFILITNCLKLVFAKR